eukprot:GHVS01021707.1.p1 GENE.GHVS01021707.1~~GHVS01021707.1.p1  ORF type:complete len:381 (-),score=39.76 GHVS01021707.1:179-1321(-)
MKGFPPPPMNCSGDPLPVTVMRSLLNYFCSRVRRPMASCQLVLLFLVYLGGFLHHTVRCVVEPKSETKGLSVLDSSAQRLQQMATMAAEKVGRLNHEDGTRLPHLQASLLRREHGTNNLNKLDEKQDLQSPFALVADAIVAMSPYRYEGPLGHYLPWALLDKVSTISRPKANDETIKTEEATVKTDDKSMAELIQQAEMLRTEVKQALRKMEDNRVAEVQGQVREAPYWTERPAAIRSGIGSTTTTSANRGVKDNSHGWDEAKPSNHGWMAEGGWEEGGVRVDGGSASTRQAQNAVAQEIIRKKVTQPITGKLGELNSKLASATRTFSRAAQTGFELKGLGIFALATLLRSGTIGFMDGSLESAQLISDFRRARLAAQAA